MQCENYQCDYSYISTHNVILQYSSRIILDKYRH